MSKKKQQPKARNAIALAALVRTSAGFMGNRKFRKSKTRLRQRKQAIQNSIDND